MAMLTHRSGEQLAQTRVKAKANFDEVVSVHGEVDAGDMIVIGSGQGLEQFRANCQTNFEFIATELSIPTAIVVAVAEVQTIDLSVVSNLSQGTSFVFTTATGDFSYTIPVITTVQDMIDNIVGSQYFGAIGAGDYWTFVDNGDESVTVTQDAGNEGPVALITMTNPATGSPVAVESVSGVAAILLAETVQQVNDGSMLWEVRDLLNDNFVLIAAS